MGFDDAKKNMMAAMNNDYKWKMIVSNKQYVYEFWLLGTESRDKERKIYARLFRKAHSTAENSCKSGKDACDPEGFSFK